MAHKFWVTLEVTVPTGQWEGDMWDMQERVARSIVVAPCRIESAKTEILDVQYQTPHPGEEEDF